MLDSDWFLTKTLDTFNPKEDFLIDYTAELEAYLSTGGKGLFGRKKTYSFDLYRPIDPKTPVMLLSIEKDGRKKLFKK